jgi:hypothetical protein
MIKRFPRIEKKCNNIVNFENNKTHNENKMKTPNKLLIILGAFK